ncbi:MAG: nucleotidyltransferase domain-containing protein [Bacteroidia bacterium]|nr:nucleotidyltransferase domain-containing protein [Bacteroidia bacterium]
MRLPEALLEELRRIFAQHPKVERVVLFGSWAAGTAKPYSDIDLAVWGLSPQEAARIALDLEELPFPYRFDVIAYTEALSPSLKIAILSGIEVFCKK